METTVYILKKADSKRLKSHSPETIRPGSGGNADDIWMITDLDGDMLISECGCTYPLRVPDTSRADVGYDRKKRPLRRQYE